MRTTSSSDQDSHCSDSGGGCSGRSLGWSDEDSHHNGGPRSNSSWEGDSICDSSVHSYSSCDSDCGSISTEQRVREYTDYDPYASDKDSNSRKDSGEGKSPGSEDGLKRKGWGGNKQRAAGTGSTSRITTGDHRGGNCPTPLGPYSFPLRNDLGAADLSPAA